MGIPMWREPAKAEANKTALEKDPSAATRSSIGRRGRAYRARRSGMLSSFHSQIIEELRRGPGSQTNAERFPEASPVIHANGVSEDGVTLEDLQREAWGRQPPYQVPRRRSGHHNRQSRNTRTAANFLASSDSVNALPGFSYPTRPSSGYTPSYLGQTQWPSSSDSPGIPVRLPPLRRTDSYGSDLARFLQANAHMPPEVMDLRSRNDRSRLSRRAGVDGVMDGLGDRQRSPSPDGERETDAWETLLSTITPDATLPSNDSSFASTSAAAPDARNRARPAHSSSLGSRHVTLDPYPDHLNPCDFSSSDDEESPRHREMLILEREALRARETRRRERNSTLSAHPPLPPIAFAIQDNSNHSSDEIQQMQVILDRLAGREDNHHDWWAAVGVTPTLNRGLNDSMDSTDTESTARPGRDN
ncbi:hypothetical protein MYU51_000911 [Penicillium brevicompactum]